MCERWTQNAAKHVNVTPVAWENVDFCSSSGHLAKRIVVKLIGRPHLNVFQQNRRTFLNVDVYLNFIRARKTFVISQLLLKQ